MTENAPIFIVGSPRSGTNLLRLILCGHSRIHILPETWFIEDLVRELPLTRPLSPEEVGRAAAILTGHKRWPDMEIPARDFEAWAGALAAPRLVDVINLIYHHHLKLTGKSRFGDKTHAYVEIIPELSALYPDARFIHLIRDGRDVAISLIKVGWAHYYERDFLWKRRLRFRRECADAPFANQILDVRYEDLVTKLEPTVAGICAFLDEEFEPGMLDWQHRTPLIPQRERHFHSRVARPLEREHVELWREELSLLECFAMESCLHQDLRRLGYELRFGAVGWRPVLSLCGSLLSAAAPLLKRGIPYLQRRNVLPRTIYF